MLSHLINDAAGDSLPVHAVTAAGFEAWREIAPAPVQAWLRANAFTARAGRSLTLPDGEGALAGVLVVVEEGADIWSYAALPGSLPAGRYHLADTVDAAAATAAAIGWALGCYAFTRYKTPGDDDRPNHADLVWPEAADRAAVTREVEAIGLARDLINTPAEDLGPEELAQAASILTERYDAQIQVSVGDQLLERNFPAIYSVGRASTRAPRLIDIHWRGHAAEGRPLRKLAIVGKGVCFDTGGLDLKPSSAMLLMKKDMGGAAHALALAQMVMDAALPLELRVLIPAVDNAVAGDAFRPLDVLKTRKGMTVEVGNTDAEGRLVLADALTAAGEDEPELVIDFATLTGAARVALGPEIPALFTNDDTLARRLSESSERTGDPLWRLPLHKDYRALLDSDVADINNISPGGYGGAITAALFLQEFTPPRAAWAHFDVMAWNTRARPGRPKGGEAMGLRASYGAIRDWLAAQE